MFKWVVLFVLVSCIVYYDNIVVLNDNLPDVMYNASQRILVRDLERWDQVVHIGSQFVIVYVASVAWLGCSAVVLVGETIKNLF